VRGEGVREDFGDEGIDKERDVCALDCAGGGVGGRDEVRGVRVGEELGYDCGFGDYGAVVGDCGDEAALDG
jgi:hypothetical protein